MHFKNLPMHPTSWGKEPGTLLPNCCKHLNLTDCWVCHTSPDGSDHNSVAIPLKLIEKCIRNSRGWPQALQHSQDICQHPLLSSPPPTHSHTNWVYHIYLGHTHHPPGTWRTKGTGMKTKLMPLAVPGVVKSFVSDPGVLCPGTSMKEQQATLLA